MPVIGAHLLLYTPAPDELRRVLSEAFGWRSVDAGEGWLIFAAPPAELGVHPADRPRHELTLMCDDLEATVAELAARGITFAGEVQDAEFGTVATMMLPGEVPVLLYEPRHPTALDLVDE